MLTLTNDFHNTSVRMRLRIGNKLVPWATYRRWMRTLCPFEDCTCPQATGAQLDDGTKVQLMYVTVDLNTVSVAVYKVEE